MKNENGSFTVESSLIFPVVLWGTICLILTSLVIFDKVILNYHAQKLADQAAYVWDNSQRHIETGALALDAYSTAPAGDGLYWRLFDNQIIDPFKHMLTEHEAPIVHLGVDQQQLAGLPAQKLNRITTKMLPSGTTGTMRYENEIIGKKVIVELEREIRMPSFIQKLIFKNSIQAQATAYIHDPVETVRSTDLVVTYARQLKQFGQSFFK